MRARLIGVSWKTLVRWSPQAACSASGGHLQASALLPSRELARVIASLKV